MTTVIQVEPLADIAVDVTDLLHEHYEELATNKVLMHLAPKWDAYFQLERLKLFYALTARVDGKLVGYSAVMQTPHLHYSMTTASSDVLFVSKEHRASSIGLRLIKATEAEAKSRGADALVWRAKPDSPLHKILLARHYPVQDVTFLKAL